MKITIFNKIFREVLIDFVTMTFTIDNLKIARDMIIERLCDAAENTDTQIDDWAVALVERILSDENLGIVLNFIKDNIGVNPDGTCKDGACKLQKAPVVDYKTLALAIADNEDKGNTCCNISLSALLQVLEIIMPYLIDWYMNGK